MVAQQVELAIDRLPSGQLGVGVALRGDQLTTDLGGTDAGKKPLGLELGIGLALAIDEALDVIEESRQMLLGGLAAAGGEGIEAGHSGAEFVHRLADGFAVPAEMGLGPDLSTPSHRMNGPGHEEPTLAPLEGLGRVDQDGDHLGVGSHGWRSKSLRG